MRHHRKAAGVVDEIDGVSRRHFELGHPRGLPLFQESIKRFVHARTEPRLDEGTRDVGPSGRAAVSYFKDHFLAQWNVEFLNGLHHFTDAVLTHLLKPGEFPKQSGISYIEKVAKHVQLVAVEFSRQFSSWNELDVRRLTGRRHAHAAFDRVVIAQGHCPKAQALSMRGQLLRCVGAIGEIRVKMQVRKHDGPVERQWRAGLQQPNHPSIRQFM